MEVKFFSISFSVSNQFNLILLNDIGGTAWEMSTSPRDLESGSDSFKAFCFQMNLMGEGFNVYSESLANRVEKLAESPEDLFFGFDEPPILSGSERQKFSN